jgi:hypothetical protein
MKKSKNTESRVAQTKRGKSYQKFIKPRQQIIKKTKYLNILYLYQH